MKVNLIWKSDNTHNSGCIVRQFLFSDNCVFSTQFSDNCVFSTKFSDNFILSILFMLYTVRYSLYKSVGELNSSSAELIIKNRGLENFITNFLPTIKSSKGEFNHDTYTENRTYQTGT